jgi:hypothetical protein
MAPVARSETRPGGSPAPWRLTRSGFPLRPPNAPSRTRHRLDPLAPLITRVALGAVMLPHGAQGSWEGSAVYLAEELRHTRIRVNAADPGYTATDFNVVPAGEVADFKSGAPAAGRGIATASTVPQSAMQSVTTHCQAYSPMCTKEGCR